MQLCLTVLQCVRGERPIACRLSPALAPLLTCHSPLLYAAWDQGGSGCRLQQLVQELQACVLEFQDDHLCFHGPPEDELPAVLGLMLPAARLGHMCAARHLLLVDPTTALNMDAEYTSQSPLHEAAVSGQAALVRQLLAAVPAATLAAAVAAAACTHGSNGYIDGWTLMHSAAAGGSVETIQALLEIAPDATGWLSDFSHTPLHEACGGGHIEAARLLLEAAPHTAAVEVEPQQGSHARLLRGPERDQGR